MAVSTTGGKVTTPGKQRSEGEYQTAEKRKPDDAAGDDGGSPPADDENPFSSPDTETPRPIVRQTTNSLR